MLRSDAKHVASEAFASCALSSLDPGIREPDGARRIALITFSLAAGGAERVMSLMSRYWTERGRDVTLVTLASTDTDFFPIDPRVRRVSCGCRPARGRLRAAVERLRRVRRLRAVLRETRPDVVISFIDGVNILTLLAAAGLRVPVIVSERTDPTRHRLRRAQRLLRRLLYPRAAALVVQTGAVRRWALRILPARKVVVIPNPVDPCVSRDNEVRVPQLRGRNGAPTIIALGRFSWEKGFDLLLHAFARTRAVHPEWKLVLFGDGDQRGTLEALVDTLGLRESVRFAGKTRDPGAELRAADMFVLPSRYEGFPNALLEAMACGLPVVATDCPSGPGQLVRSGIDGVLVAAEDPASLAAAMAALMRNPEERTRLGRNALAVRQRFGLGAVMREWDSVIAQVRSGSGR